MAVNPSFFLGPQVDTYTPLASLGQTFMSSFEKGRKTKQEREGGDLRAKWGETLYGQPQEQPQPGFTSLASLGQPPQQPAGQSPMAGDQRAPRVDQAFAAVPQSYMASARASESGGNDQARNPNSSATGRYQFLDSTWQGLMRSNPELGLTADGRMDPAQQERAMQAFTAQNAQALRSAGLPTDGGSLYAAHFLGAGGAQKVLSAPDTASVAALVGPEVVQANPQLANMSVGAFKQWAAQKGGGGSDYGSAMPASGTRYAQAGGAPGGGQIGLPPREILIPMLRNPETAQLAGQIISAARSGAMSFEKVGDDLVAIDKNTGEARVVYSGTSQKAPTVTDFYDEKTGQQYKAQWNPQSNTWDRVGGTKAPNGMSIKTNPDGTVEVTQGGAGGGKLTEGQSKDVVYYTRGIDADKQLAGLDTQLTDLPQQAAGALPLGIGNYLRNPAFRQAKSAADGFLTAVLRKDTGAAITNQEFEIYGPMFLPVPGDDPGTIQQKRRARHVALLAIRSGLGTAEAVAEANRNALGIEEQPVPPGAEGAQQGQPMQIQSPQQYQSLPPGTQYVAPDGSVRTKR